MVDDRKKSTEVCSGQLEHRPARPVAALLVLTLVIACNSGKLAARSWTVRLKGPLFVSADSLQQNTTTFSDRVFALGDELDEVSGGHWSMVARKKGDRFPNLAEKRSWVPTLGQIVWEIPKNDELRGYYAYICRLKDGKKIGYVRVPDYEPDRETVQIFQDIIARFEATTSAMVLDEIDNPGGDLRQMYALLSALSDRPLVPLKQLITIDEDDTKRAAFIVEQAEAGNLVAPEMQKLVAYERFLISERAAGRGKAMALSGPVYLWGVDEITPSTRPYTKSIVVLTNELSFSAAEFLAAILQDNRRATVFGMRTAGAGGCVKEINVPSKLISHITLTWTVALRANGNYLEDAGVDPDVTYDRTLDDVLHGYNGYRHALLDYLDPQMSH